MPELPRCPTCGNVLSESLAGQCPACLLKGGLPASGPETVPYQTQSADTGDARSTGLPSPGQEFGAYHIVRALGRGGMGSVFEAEEHDTGRRVALKVLNHSLDSPGARQRFLREGQLAAALNHPQSVYVFGAEEIDGAPVIAMELVPGGTLQDRVRKHGPLPIQESVDAILQIVDGLEAAHAVGVLHRDVKPSNCFIDGDGRVKVGDFGLSISKEARGNMQLTISGVFLGTPTFASPEQLRGDELDVRSDLYAVGVTLYYLLTGQVPFEADTMVHLVAKVLDKPAPDVRVLRPGVPRELAAVIACCLAKEPNRRYRSYADLRSKLLPFGSALPSPASPARRFIAGSIDFGLLFVLNMTLLPLFGGQMFVPGAGEWKSQMLMMGLGFTWFLLYYIVPEGLAGVTIGKWLLSMRVVRTGQKDPPGLWRAAVRTVIFEYFPVMPFLGFALAQPNVFDADGQIHLTGSIMLGFMLAALGYYLFYGLLVITMRRSNGYAGLHDLVSGTRVVDRPAQIQRPMLNKRAEPADEPTPATANIGPYHVLADLGSTVSGQWHLGFDPRLFRKVWLCVVPAGTPAIPSARQNCARPGRLRWLAGRRGPDENWDAFETPTGQSLWQLLDRPHDWSHVRFWLLDLAEELAAALKDDTLPEALDLDRVWITSEGRAVLLDQEAPGLRVRTEACIITQPREVAPVMAFLRLIAAAALSGRRIDFAQARSTGCEVPLPLHARTIVDGLVNVQRPEVVAAQIEAVLAKSTRVSKARRAGILAACFTFPLLSLLIWLPQMIPGLRGEPEAVDLFNAVQWYSPPIAGWGRELSAKEKNALEIYFAGPQRERISDPATWTQSYQGGARIALEQRKAVEEALARTSPPTEEEVKDALAVVGPRLKMTREGPAELMGPVAWLALIFTMTAVMYVAVPAVLCALIFRGGPLWWIFGISAVTRIGQPAGRLRLAIRNLIAWSPLFVLPIVLALLAPLVGDMTVPIVCLAITSAAAALVSTFGGERSWPDRLVGTWLVIR